MKSGLIVKKDNLANVLEATRALTYNRVMAGIPQDKDERRDDDELGNADIGYLMENGIPEANVPARPHLVPGVRNVQARITDLMRQAGQLAMEGKTEGVLRALNAVGLTAQSSIKAVIRAGIPPPLAPSTLAARKAKGFKGEKPLIRSGQYLAAITYVIRYLGGK